MPRRAGLFSLPKKAKKSTQMVRGQIGKNKIIEGSGSLQPVCKSAAIFRHKAIGITVGLNFVKNIAIFLCILRIICYNKHIPRRGCGVMGGYFAAVSKEDCVFDLFFGLPRRRLANEGCGRFFPPFAGIRARPCWPSETLRSAAGTPRRSALRRRAAPRDRCRLRRG